MGGQEGEEGRTSEMLAGGNRTRVHTRAAPETTRVHCGCVSLVPHSIVDNVTTGRRRIRGYTIRKKYAPATRINSRHAGKRATAASVSVDGTRDDVCK